MPTIVFASPKGGAGKTTAALVLANQLARSAPVALVDADPNQPLKGWAKGASIPNVTVVSDVDEDNIIDRIEEAASKVPFVIVDLEGTAAKIVLLAISQADLVLIPTQGSQLDAEQASRALRVIRQQEKMTGRAVPYSVLMTRTNVSVRTRTTMHIKQSLETAGIPVLQTELHEREAFRSMFSFRQPLHQLSSSDVNNLDKAVANAEAFGAEVVNLLRAKRASADAPSEGALA